MNENKTSRSPRHFLQPIGYWSMEWDANTYVRGEDRTATLSLDLPHPILFRLLVTPTSDWRYQNMIAEYLIQQVHVEADKTLKYLEAFFERIATECSPLSLELEVMEDWKGGDFDFPRPSPSWIMMEEFCRVLRKEPLFGDLLAKRCRRFMR